jgi:hypothetical protein
MSFNRNAIGVRVVLAIGVSAMLEDRVLATLEYAQPAGLAVKRPMYVAT